MKTLNSSTWVSCVLAASCVLLFPKVGADDSTAFESRVRPFLESYCFDCHDEETQKGDVAFHELNGITAENARLWKSIWEQVALKEMPPKKRKAQPNLEERHQLTELILPELQRVLKDQGGFHEHLHPSKGNLLDHDLLFGDLPKNLKPTFSPVRIWRLHPQEHTSPDSTNW